MKHCIDMHISVQISALNETSDSLGSDKETRIQILAKLSRLWSESLVNRESTIIEMLDIFFQRKLLKKCKRLLYG